MNSDGGSLTIGIALTLLTGFLFASMDASSKVLMGVAPVLQIIWVRYLVHAAAIAAYYARKRQSFLRTQHPVLQALRSVVLLVSTLAMYYGIQRVPLADATAILFVAPLLITITSAIMLGERIGVFRAFGVVLGLAGVMMIMRPGHGGFSVWLLLPLLAAMSNTVYFMLTKKLSSAREFAATQFNTTAIGAVALTVIVAPLWQPISPVLMLLLVGVGALSVAGHVILQCAFTHASAALLSPYLYSHLIFAALFGALFFGDTLRISMIAGSAFIVGAGLITWWLETGAGKKS